MRLRNQLVPDTEGGYTLYTGETTPIYDAAMAYRAANVPLHVLAGKDYGTGSSRDWAAKGPALLGVRAVLAESFERIHRSNLVGMGIPPLQFIDGDNADTLGLTGHETFTITALPVDEILARVDSRAFRLDQSQRCAVPGIARNAPSDARFFECETSLHTPDASGALWNYSIITFSARGGNYVDVLFGTFTFPQPFTANRTVNGRPARWAGSAGSYGTASKLEVPGEPGRQLIVSVRSCNCTEAEIQSIAEAVQFSGDPRDITTWPTNPAP